MTDPKAWYNDRMLEDGVEFLCRYLSDFKDMCNIQCWGTIGGITNNLKLGFSIKT